MKTYQVKTIEDTARVAKEWLGSISESASKKLVASADGGVSAFVVGLSGHLGAGKTAFVKCVAKELGIREEVTSPTFVIMKIYDIDPKGVSKRFGRDFPWRRLVHIDAYRLEKREELQAIRFEDVASDPANLVLVEWPEQVDVKEIYPTVSFSLDKSGKGRVIQY